MTTSCHAWNERQSNAPNGVPNKPMVPTAPTSHAVNPSRPLRRHIGQPLGGPALQNGRVTCDIPASRQPT